MPCAWRHVLFGCSHTQSDPASLFEIVILIIVFISIMFRGNDVYKTVKVDIQKIEITISKFKISVNRNGVHQVRDVSRRRNRTRRRTIGQEYSEAVTLFIEPQ